MIKKEKAPKAVKEPKQPKKVKEPKAPKTPKAPKEPKAPKVKMTKEEKQAAKEAKKAAKVAAFNPLNSIKFKVIVLVIVGIVVASTLVAISMVSYAKGLIVDASYGKMNNIVSSYGSVVGLAEEDNKGKSLQPEEYAATLADLKVDGAPNSYCFVVDKAGLVRYHGDESMIGKPNKNKKIQEITAQFNKGTIREGNSTLEYEENGEIMYASYYITTSKSIIVMCASGAELMASVNVLIYRALIIIAIILVAAIFVTLYIVNGFTKPLNRVTAIIDDTAKLKLQLPEDMDKLCNRSDETGIISRAVRDMSTSLHEVVQKIDESNGNIKANMEKLEKASNEVHINCTDNSATTEQLVANTVEMSELTSFMTEQVDEMTSQFKAIEKEASNGSEASMEIAGRAKNMQESSEQAIDNTRNIYSQIKEKTDQAIEGLKAISKINELTNSIMEVSDQTSLLSLNASIEAARVGEAGRGFAVVASEISTLAHRTQETVSDIDAITGEINKAVSNITQSMEETASFLENTVLADYDNFNQLGSQYMSDADTFRDEMESISAKNVQMNEAITKVASAVEHIQNSIQETTAGINNIADKTSTVVGATSENYQLTSDTVASVDKLQEIVEKFEF